MRQVRLWDIAYLRELRHMHEHKGDDDDDDDDDDEEEEDDEEEAAAAEAVGGEEDEEEEEEEDEEIAFQPRKKVKPLTQGTRSAIKMGSDFFSDM